MPARDMLYTLTLVHIAFMLGSLVPAAAGLVFAVMHLATGRHYGRMVGTTFLGALMLFIGGIPLGWAVAYVKTGVGWGGMPIGWDFTDNKTLILIIYWTLCLTLARKALLDIFRAREPRPVKAAVSRRTMAWLVVYGSTLETVIFLIPHSIKLPSLATFLALGAAALPTTVVMGVTLLRGGRDVAREAGA